MVCLSDLKTKDVVSIVTGQNIGRADDIEFDEKTAVIHNIVIFGRPKFFGIFGREKDLKISWKDIVTIGKDVVLINAPEIYGGGKNGKTNVTFDQTEKRQGRFLVFFIFLYYNLCEK